MLASPRSNRDEDTMHGTDEALLAQLAEAPRSERGGSGFESRVGHAKERWPSGYGSALLRRTPGDRCEGSSP